MKLICFDLDNTLVDSDELHIFAFQEAFKEHKLPEVEDKVIKDLLSIQAENLIKKIYPELDDKKNKEVTKTYKEYLIKYSNRYIKLFPNVLQILKKIKKRYKIALISNTPHKGIISMLNSVGIDTKIFDVIIGTDDVNHGKPDADEILKAEELTKHKAEYMIGDSIYDIIAGKKAGCKTIAVLTGDFSKEELEKEKPDYIINDLSELKDILEF